MRQLFVPLAILPALMLVGGHEVEAKKSASASVSYLDGKASILRNAKRYTDKGVIKAKAPWKAIGKGNAVQPGDAVKVADKGRLELTIADGSKVRLAGGALVTFDKGQFHASGERNVTLRVWVGRLWASVAKRLGSKSTFEVKTQNAVAGVRGTSFAVVARSDLSSVVKVYAGSVGVTKAVAAAPANANRVQIAGPKRIDKKQWEEVILSAMQQVSVSAIGEIMPAEEFVDEGDELQWAAWNQERDSDIIH